MSEVCVRLPEIIIKELRAAPRTGLYKDTNEFVKEAINLLLSARKDVRLAIALELYRDGAISLGRMAELAGVSYEEAKKILISNKIPIRRGAESLRAVLEDSKVLLEKI